MGNDVRPPPPVGYVLDPVRERYPERYLLGPRTKDFGPERGTPPGWAQNSPHILPNEAEGRLVAFLDHRVGPQSLPKIIFFMKSKFCTKHR